MTYDSMQSIQAHRPEVKNDVTWLKKCFSVFYTFDKMNSWDLDSAPGCPKQSPTSLDCAIFLLKFVEFICKGETKMRLAHVDLPKFKATYAADILDYKSKIYSDHITMELEDCRTELYILLFLEHGL